MVRMQFWCYIDLAAIAAATLFGVHYLVELLCGCGIACLTAAIVSTLVTVFVYCCMQAVAQEEIDEEIRRDIG